MSARVIRVPRLPTPFLLMGTIDHSRQNPFLETVEEVESRILNGDPEAEPPRGLLRARG